MTDVTKIEWCDHTFNPWRGCTKVHEGCRNCYAETLSKRNPSVLGTWGPLGQRVIAKDSYWRKPHKWNEDAERDGVRRRVFCASLADVFEDSGSMPADQYSKVRGARARLFRLIQETQNLDWLLLTKRPQNVLWQVEEAEQDSGRRFEYFQNAWLGMSVSDQPTAEKYLKILNSPEFGLGARFAVQFASVEPLIGPVDLLAPVGDDPGYSLLPDWVIVGGESGGQSRPCDVAWIDRIVGQCQSTHTPVFVKQLGRSPVQSGETVTLKDRKGGDPAEWPEWLRVREFPAGVLVEGASCV